jgi:AcrR family transcriptional regulator
MYIRMRKAVAAALTALALSTASSVDVAAWGSNGHKLIMDRAIELLPPELKPFFQKYRATLVERSIDPDTYRSVGFAEEPPRHFVDMDAYGPFPFPNLPHEYEAAVAKFGVDFVTKNGTLPWRTQEMFDRLRNAFGQLATNDYARENVELFSAVVSHYVGDAFQPLHACVNYDGQLTHQQGIHARFESELLDRYEAKLHVTPAPVMPIPNAREFVFAALGDSFQKVEPILAADREATHGLTAYDDEYFARMWTRTGPIMEQRLSGAMTAVAAFITQAWIDAGKPPLPAERPARAPRPIRR